MPFNILLLPLLAGFVVLARARLFSYATSQLEKEQLLLRVSLAGLLLLLSSRVICVALADTFFGQCLIQLKQALAPFPYMGTAVGTLLLAVFFVLAVNRLIPEEEAGLWLYHSERFNQLEGMFFLGALGVRPSGRMGYLELFLNQFFLDWERTRQHIQFLLGKRTERLQFSCFETGDPQLVMVTLNDNKVYVGLVSQLPPIVASRFEYFRILPVWSGYRDPRDRRVYRTTDYQSAVLVEGDREKLVKVLPVSSIAAVGLYVDGTFSTDHAEPDEAPTPRVGNTAARAVALKRLMY